MNELISVVIPTYNRENTIEKCLESVLNQTYSNIEVIVVDDCSKDNTIEVVKKIKDKRIKLYKLEKNSGACFARNYGVEKSRGKYIAFQDSDDIWIKNKLEKQYNYLLNTDADMVFCGMNRYTKNNTYVQYFPSCGFNNKKNGLFQELYENRISTQCILIKKEITDRIKFDNSIRRYQDWDYAIRISMNCKMRYLNEALVESEIQENSISKVVVKLKALTVIYNKYKNLIELNKKIDGRFMYKFAEENVEINKRKAIKYYLKSLKKDTKIHTFLKMIKGIIK